MHQFDSICFLADDVLEYDYFLEVLHLAQLNEELLDICMQILDTDLFYFQKFILQQHLY